MGRVLANVFITDVLSLTQITFLVLRMLWHYARVKQINPFLVNVPILYPLKTLKNLWFSHRLFPLGYIFTYNIFLIQ